MHILNWRAESTAVQNMISCHLLGPIVSVLYNMFQGVLRASFSYLFPYPCGDIAVS